MHALRNEMPSVSIPDLWVMGRTTELPRKAASVSAELGHGLRAAADLQRA
jgi:hypothetical protein